MDGSAPTPSDAELAALCAQGAGGNEEAITALLHLHHARLFGFIKRKIGPDWQGKIEPEDVLQEAYVEIFKAMPSFTFQGPDSFYHWASRIIDHRFIDHARHWRRKKRDVARETGQGAGGAGSGSRHDTLLERCLPVTMTASRIMRREEAVGALMSCLAKLPADYRTAVQRLYLDEAPLATVAEEMDRSPDAVRRLASRALEHLSACMGQATRYISGKG